MHPMLGVAQLSCAKEGDPLVLSPLGREGTWCAQNMLGAVLYCTELLSAVAPVCFYMCEQCSSKGNRQHPGNSGCSSHTPHTQLYEQAGQGWMQESRVAS